ncbi:MAG TPA: TetR family transcriptional regulator [Jatrophihabitans sp.]|jgi:AcrR family transcriptional regulator
MASGQSRAERKEATRQRLLDVTLQLIGSRSLDSISLREVARAAGIVPTAFYRHFESMDQLGVELVDECIRPLRQMVRDTRRGVASHGDIIEGTIQVLGEYVAAHADQFGFLIRERYGGVRQVRRAIDTELTLFTSELAVDLARLTAGYDWSTDDLEMTAALMVGAMLKVIIDLVEIDVRPAGRKAKAAAILERGARQLRLIALGMTEWRSK